MLGEARERESASPLMNGWLGFDSLGALFDTWASSCLPGGKRQILDDFVNQETRTHLNDFSLLVLLSLRRSIKASCSLAFSTAWLDTGLHGSNAQAIVYCKCCRQPLVN